MRMGHVMALDVRATHVNNPDCPCRIVLHPDKRTYYCLDCGFAIVMKAVEVDLDGVTPKLVPDELVDALDLVKKRGEDWEAAEADNAIAAGNLEERMQKVERLLIIGVDKIAEKEGQ